MPWLVTRVRLQQFECLLARLCWQSFSPRHALDVDTLQLCNDHRGCIQTGVCILLVLIMTLAS